MRIAVIEHGMRDYILDTLNEHPQFACNVIGFGEWRPQTSEYKGIPVFALDRLDEAIYDAVLIGVRHNHHLSRLLAYLHDKGVENIYVLRLYTIEMQADFVAGDKFDLTCVDKIPGPKEKPYLVHLETHVCDHCNLNCKACNNFSPFVKQRHVTDLVQFERDIRRVAELFSDIGRMYLLGGEPLLEPKLTCEMIGISRRYFPSAELRLLTNATLAGKMTQAFWECLRNNGVIVHISLYPPMRERIPAIEGILQENGVTYLIAKIQEKFLKRLTLYPFEDAVYNNSHCGSAGCSYLRDGVISKCPDTVLAGMMAPAVGILPEELADGSSASVLTEANDGWQIIRRLNAPCKMCKKCTLRRKEWIVWEAAGGDPDPADWLLENRLEYENRLLREQLKALREQYIASGREP